jgi:hypothetical protein
MNDATIRKSNISSSIYRSIVYTLGHIVVATCCVILIAGANLELAAVDAIVEPLIDGAWYFLLDYLWASNSSK